VACLLLIRSKRRLKMKKIFFGIMVGLLMVLGVERGFSKPPVPNSLERPEEERKTSPTF
jgi:hypothetical protein